MWRNILHIFLFSPFEISHECRQIRGLNFDMPRFQNTRTNRTERNEVCEMSPRSNFTVTTETSLPIDSNRTDHGRINPRRRTGVSPSIERICSDLRVSSPPLSLSLSLSAAGDPPKRRRGSLSPWRARVCTYACTCVCCARAPRG